MSQIRITQFHRCMNVEVDKVDWQARTILTQNSVLMNVIIFTCKQKSKICTIQHQIINKTQQNSINFIKFYSKTGLVNIIKQAFESNHKKTICIIDKSRIKLFSEELSRNQQNDWVKKYNNIGVIYYTNKVEELNPINFMLQNVRLITTDLKVVQNYLDKQITELKSLRMQISSSSLDSEEQKQFEREFTKNFDDIKLKSIPQNFILKPNEYVMNKTPGVGSYMIKNYNKKQAIGFSGRRQELFKVDKDVPGVGQYDMSYRQPYCYRKINVFISSVSREIQPIEWINPNPNYSYNQWWGSQKKNETYQKQKE